MIHEVYGHIIEIWEPRYKDKKALIGRHHVMEGTNYITFTKAEHLKDKVFEIHSSQIKSCPIQANGRGEVYCVPMASLKLVGHLTDVKRPTVTITNTIIADTLKRQGFTILEQDSDNKPIHVQAKRNNILATVEPDTVYFDEFVKTGRTFGFQEIDYTVGWKALEDLSLTEIPNEIRETNEPSETLTKNPLFI